MKTFSSLLLTSSLLPTIVQGFTSSTRGTGFATSVDLLSSRSLAPFWLDRQRSSCRRRGDVATFMSSAEDEAGSGSTEDPKVDVDAIIKYGGALAVQVGLIFAGFSGLDKIVELTSIHVPFAANFILFYFMALKSRVFNPLANDRPRPDTMETDETEKEAKRIMPSWTPPGFVFPIVWLLIIGPIRAATSAMVYNQTLSYAHPAIMALMLHLSIGDVWNTINNVEKRFGVSVVGVVLVWLSKANAALRYFSVVPLAGKLLGVTMIWLTIAASLITATWRLNPDPATGKPEPLFPMVGEKKTKISWFSSEED